MRCRGPALSVITLDLGLPDNDRHVVAQALQTLSPAPLLFLTARAEEDDILSGLAAGAAAYLTKPFRPGTLRETALSLSRLQSKFTGTCSNTDSREVIKDYGMDAAPSLPAHAATQWSGCCPSFPLNYRRGVQGPARSDVARRSRTSTASISVMPINTEL
jgi:CheY-like chemotaxis protein